MERLISILLSLRVKFFIVFFIASSLIMGGSYFAALLMIGEKLGHPEYVSRYTDVAEKVVEQYERRQRWARQRNIEPRRRLKRLEGREALVFAYIQDDDGRSILVNRSKPLRADIRFEVISESGERYHVGLMSPQVSHRVSKLLFELTEVQLISGLFVAFLFALVMGGWVARPIRRLSSYAKARTSESPIDMPVQVLSRRDELGELAASMSSMVSQLEIAIDNQRTVLHDVSHEVRAPLARMQALIGLLEQNPEAVTIETLHKEIERIDTLLGRMLTLSRVEVVSGQRSSVRLDQLVQQVIDDLSVEAPTRRVELVAEPVEVEVIEPLLIQALENIVRNADKYSDDELPIDIRIEGGAHPKIIVEDYGPGVPQEEIDMLTRPFYRGGNMMHTDGYGLGLSIAKRAVEAQRGAIAFENRNEGGFRVILTL